MSLIEFVKKEELESFMYGVVSQMNMEGITEENVIEATEWFTKFKDTYDVMEKDFGNEFASNYTASYIAIMLLVMSSSGLDGVNVIPKKQQ